MSAITCFWLEPVARAERMLRRYYRSDGGARPECSTPTGYHDVGVILEQVDLPLGEPGSGDDRWPHDDPRWPAACACGYVFAERDHWQHGVHRLYERSDTRELISLWGMRVPPGAMWDATWMGDDFRGPDGRCLCVMTPGGQWLVDGPASNGGRWTRSGRPPKITANPSIAIGNPERYHGWLRDGVLVPA